MNEVIYKGLKLSTGCKYFKAVQGKTCSLVEDKNNSTLILTFTENDNPESVSKLLGVQCLDKNVDLEETTNAIRLQTVTVSLNDLKLQKLTSDSHTINIIIVNDSESRVVQDYKHTTIVVSREDYKNQEFINFLFFSGNLVYLKPVGPKPKCWNLRNFPKIIVKDKNLELTSTSEEVFTLRRNYDDYVIRAVDYQDQAILELRRIINEYGLELVRVNKEATLKKTSYITYQFSQTPSKIHHPNYCDVEDRILQQKIPINFTLHTTDMVMFFDFKNEYNNVNLLTNFCEFKTMDKYGKKWTAAIKWGGITEDFNHQYQQDDNSNFAYQCNFTCELYFYEVFDDRYDFLKEITHTLESSNNK